MIAHILILEFIVWGYCCGPYDCKGICPGTAVTDQCGQCLDSTGDANYNNCIGCDNVPFSGKEYNFCGRCINATRSDFDDYGLFFM